MDTQATLWEIPIAIATKSSGFAGHSPVLWMGKDTLLTSHAIDAGSWIVVNPDAYGTAGMQIVTTVALHSIAQYSNMQPNYGFYVKATTVFCTTKSYQH